MVKLQLQSNTESTSKLSVRSFQLSKHHVVSKTTKQQATMKSDNNEKKNEMKNAMILLCHWTKTKVEKVLKYTDLLFEIRLVSNSCLSSINKFPFTFDGFLQAVYICIERIQALSQHEQPLLLESLLLWSFATGRFIEMNDRTTVLMIAFFHSLPFIRIDKLLVFYLPLDSW